MTSSTNIDLGVPCEHVADTKIRHVKRPGAGCEDCLAMNPKGWWVHLRECLTCGHVACCDSSPNRHATKHYHASKHPICASVEVGETWTWCYVDERFLSE